MGSIVPCILPQQQAYQSSGRGFPPTNQDIITSLFVVCLDSRVPRTRNEIADINLMGGREYPTRPGDKTNMDGMAR